MIDDERHKTFMMFFASFLIILHGFLMKRKLARTFGDADIAKYSVI
jgi:hypothetical protein